MQTYERLVFEDQPVPGRLCDLRSQAKRLADIPVLTSRTFRALREPHVYQGTRTKRGIELGEGLSYSPKFWLVNPSESSWQNHRFILSFGAYGSTLLMVWARSLDDALQECGDWIEEHAPGLFCDDSVQEAYEEALEEACKACGCDTAEPCDDCRESAWGASETDVTHLDNGHYLPSWEWGIYAENPTRKEVLALLGRTND